MPKTRHSIKRNDHIEYGFWLVFGSDGSVRLSRGQPSTGRGERAMSLLAKLPLSLFRTPALRGSITVNATGAADLKIDVDAAAEALKQVIGVDVDLRVTENSGG